MQKNDMLSEASHTKERLFPIGEKAGVYFTVRTAFRHNSVNHRLGGHFILSVTSGMVTWM